MTCPVCSIDNTEAIHKQVNYFKCTSCGTIFTKDKISHLIKTENDNSDERNTSELNEIRLQRVKPFVYDIKTILDFGCGYGLFVSFLRLKGYETNGIDRNTELKFEALKNNEYDVIFMVEVVEHLRNPREVLNILYSSLKVGGALYIETSFSNNIENISESSYICPSIGHVTILSKECLNLIFPVESQINWLNDNVVIINRGT